MENLIDLQTGILLKKFGSGNHKPGSGSAVALEGMLAAQMIRTVIDLTKGKPGYKDKFKDLEIIINEVENIIYPALTNLIQEDSIQFGKAIEARKARNSEKDIELKSKYANEALAELKIATEIPIALAKHCIRLTEIAMYIFDNGFQSARGDSSVAINGALSAVSGCLSIINLNLLSFRSNEWTIQMRSEADFIKKTRDTLLLAENDRQENLQNEADQIHKFYLELNEFQKGLQLNDKASNDQIEKLVSEIQNAMWRYRDSIWKNDVPETPSEIIDPIKLLKKLGYQYQQKSTLGTYDSMGNTFEVAGIIDSVNNYVSISSNFKPETIQFTIAHELGHAILHPNQVLHRDRPMDGSSLSSYDFKERQANKFASCFLMPKKLIIQQFQSLFLTNKVEINTQTALLLGFRLSELRAKCKDVRELSRFIASTTFYNHKFFPSIANQFQVSNETMAIRLEELQLISM
jgi:formiminotetrahydrofolate cyclodeaminase/Zn-dependent peptidase ImmA (M78 family)